MKEQATIEQMNEAIALFMGGSPCDQKYWAVPGHGYMLHGEGYTSHIKYHSSWDWLMPVVKTIRTMNVLSLPGGAGGWIKAASKMNSALLTIDLQKAHEGVYEFLQWYQSIQPPQVNE